jgi:hypothetical protein
MKKYAFFTFLMLNLSAIYAQFNILESSPTRIHISWTATQTMVFNGVPPNEDPWGKDLVYSLTNTSADIRTMGALGGFPLVHVWNENFSFSIYNKSTYMEAMKVTTLVNGTSYEIIVENASQLELYESTGDYYEGIQHFAEYLSTQGIAVQQAPDWAFDANWETYGFEENFTIATVINLIPILKRLGIKTITLDSGWYGTGIGENCDFSTGDFIVNPDIIGSEQDFIDFIDYLHSEGFKVRIWWVPGVAEMSTQLYQQHPDWFTDNVVSSTGDTGDIYLDPTNPEVIAWNNSILDRFLSYGVDGFKQDDIYNYVNLSPTFQQAYADLINGNLTHCQNSNPDFVINSCNCGISQNLYQMNGQNQLITSDPVGSTQYRMRAKYLKALNFENKAAILGDHIELTEGDVGPADMADPDFYTYMDFSSVVPLGMVLQTKFRQDPGSLYDAWFGLYNHYKFYNMDWINIPYNGGVIENYLLENAEGDKFYSFYTHVKDQDYTGNITYFHLVPNQVYYVFDYINSEVLYSFTSTADYYTTSVNFHNSLNVVLSTNPNISYYGLNSPMSKVNLFPNPVTDFLNLELSDNLVGGELLIYNSNGQEVVKEKNVQNMNQIDIHSLVPGIYRATIKNKNQFNSLAFIKN